MKTTPGSNIPMSKLMLRTCPTRLPGRIPKLPGDIQTRLATFLCVTSTPLGLPVVPSFENVSFQLLLANGRRRSYRAAL